MKKMTKREIKNLIWKKFNEYVDFIDKHYLEIMIGIIMTDIFIIGLNHFLWLDILDKRTIQFAKTENGNNAGLWRALKAVCSELEQDHPGITARMVDNFSVGYTAGESM